MPDIDDISQVGQAQEQAEITNTQEPVAGLDQDSPVSEQSQDEIPSEIIQIIHTGEGDYNFSKDGYAIDKGNIRSIEKIRNFLLELSTNFTKKFPKSNEEFQALIKSKNKLNVGKDVDPANESFFMPLKVDTNHKIGNWFPVIFNEEAPSFKSLDSKQKEKLIKRHRFGYKGYFDRRKIKFSNVDINLKKSILTDELIGDSTLKWAAKGIINYKTGRLSLIPGAKRRAAKKFNKKYGVDKVGDELENDVLTEDLIQDSPQNDETSEDNQESLEQIQLPPELDLYDDNIRKSVQLAVSFIKEVIKLIPKSNASMPYFKLTDKGILIDVSLSVESEKIGKMIMTSSFNIEFGETFKLNYIGSEITGIPEININLLDGKFIFQASTDSLISDISIDDHTFKASNPTIKNEINGNEITLSANDLIYHTNSKKFSGNGITGSLNLNFLGHEFKGQIKDLDFEENVPKIGLGIGKISELNFTNHFKAENIAATYVLLGNGDQRLVVDSTVNISDIGPKGVKVSKLKGRLISNIDLSNFSASPIDVKDGVLEGEFLGNNIKINGFEYASATNTFNAKKGNLDYNVFNHTGNIEIIKPSYSQESGFSFSKIEAAIDDEVTLFNLFKFNNITLRATKEGDVYGFGFSTNVSTEDIIDLTMFGQGVTISSANGNVNYDSESEKNLTFNEGAISGTISFGGCQLQFDLEGIDNSQENLSIENLNGKFFNNNLGIQNIDISGQNITFSNNGGSSEMSYESIKTIGFSIAKDFGFISASLNDAEIKNDSSNKEFLVGFNGNLKNIFPEMNDQQGDGTLDASISGLVGYDFKAGKKIFKITSLEATGTIQNPLNRLNELIKEFSSGRIDIGMSIPVFPLIYAEFGMFLEAAMTLGGSPITFNAVLSDNVINLSMDKAPIGSGHIAGGVYAGIQAGSKLIVALALFLEAYGKAMAKLEVSYHSTLTFNKETGFAEIVPKPNTFHGFDYDLEADLQLKAVLKAIATALVVFKKTFTYNIAKKSLGKFSYSSHKENNIENPRESLVTDQDDFKTEAGVEEDYANMKISELIQIDPKERFDNTEKDVIAEKFKNDKGNTEKDEEFNTRIDDTLGVAEKNHLIKIRELSSKLVKLDQITDFQNNRFDWDVIVQRVDSINSRLSAVTVEYDNNTTRSFFGREIFNYTKFGKVVKGEIIDQKYQEKLSASIQFIKDLDTVSQNFNTTEAFNSAHNKINTDFKNLQINAFANDHNYVGSILSTKREIETKQDNQIGLISKINSFKGDKLHSKRRSDLDQILSKKPLKEGNLADLESKLLNPLTTYKSHMDFHKEKSEILKKEIISQEREINSGYYASKLASLSES